MLYIIAVSETILTRPRLYNPPRLQTYPQINIYFIYEKDITLLLVMSSKIAFYHAESATIMDAVYCYK